ncbi:hypothetical protein EYF80_022713 [Liparis tanakae]|uniref:Uncharacterized protein n=1 Tax=Liparis tanakae TaxID=230148 RepID=A0A4Z2HMU1_9TELE|nr:hypothetical protein EYF80_022713 [Liparis tanakae]
MVGRDREGAESGGAASTGPLRSASTTGASVAATSASVGQTSVQPLPLAEPLPSSPATTNTSRTEHVTKQPDGHDLLADESVGSGDVHDHLRVIHLVGQAILLNLREKTAKATYKDLLAKPGQWQLVGFSTDMRELHFDHRFSDAPAYSQIRS